MAKQFQTTLKFETIEAAFLLPHEEKPGLVAEEYSVYRQIGK